MVKNGHEIVFKFGFRLYKDTTHAHAFGPKDTPLVQDTQMALMLGRTGGK